MKEVSEAYIEKKVSNYAKEKGMLCYKFISPSQRAVCDRVLMYNGLVFFIEFKAPGKKPTKSQARHHQRLVEQSIVVYVVDSVYDGLEVINHELEGKRFDRCAVRFASGDSASAKK